MAGGREPDLGPGEIADGETEEVEIEDGDDLDEGDDAGDGVEQETDADEEEGQTRDVAPRGGGRRDTIKNLRLRAQASERQLASERAERDALTRRMAELEARTRQPDPAQLAREQAEEEARVEMMTPAQVARYYAEKTEQRVAQALGRVNTQTQDRIDKAAFDAQAERDPLLRRVADQVETILAAERAAGRGTDRLIIADFVIGRQVRERRAAQLGKQRTGATRRVNRQQTRPANGGGDAPRGTGRQGEDSYEAAVRRAKGVPL